MTSLQQSLARTQRLSNMLRRSLDGGHVPCPEGALEVLAALFDLEATLETRIAEEAQEGTVAP